MTVVDASELTAAQIVALVEADSLVVDVGCWLLDSDDNYLDDISADVIAAGSSVDLGVYNTIHRSCQLVVSRQLQWGSQRVKLFLDLSDDGGGRPGRYGRLTDEDGEPLLADDGEPLLSDYVDPVAPTFYRWPLGVFVLTTPETVIDSSPQTWTVQGYDKLEVLSTPYGRSYTLPAGDAILAAVEAIITAEGETDINLDQSAAATVAASTMTYSISRASADPDEESQSEWSALTICNSLLRAIGYRALWVDREGCYRSGPYRAPDELPTVWTYDTGSSTTTIGEYRSLIGDYFDAANSVTGVNDDPEAAAVPVDGAGLYTLTNASDGPTSISARGRTIRRVIRGTFSSQASLVTAVEAALDTEKRVTDMVEVTTSPNPTHGHFDVVRFVDAAIPVDGRFLVQSWTLPLDGSDMALTLRAV